ncbi:MAG: ABC-2 family transporter protein [Candidatus ainarchaeum sp.]|nr:ABC-2 family transporter protein [Candidatus ainarchaeum sp.]
MNSQLNKYLSISFINIKESLTYIWDIIFGKVIFIALIIFVFANLWTVVFASKGEVIPGFTLSMMVWYLVFGEALVTSIGRFVKEVGDDIKSGEIANYLTKPYNYIVYKIFVSFGKGLINFMLVLFFGGIVAYLMVGGIKISLVSVPFLLIVALLAMLLNLVIASVISLFAFWIEDSSSLNYIYSKFTFIFGGMIVPLEVYPPLVEKIAAFLPFSYSAYHPSKLVLIFSFKTFLEIFIVQLLWIGFFIIILFFLYKYIIKKVSVNGG